MQNMHPQIPNPISINPGWIPGGPGAVEDCALINHRRYPGDITGKFRVKFTRWEKRALKKKKPIPVSAWAELYRYVQSDSPMAHAGVPVPWKNATTPYLTGIMDAAFFESVEEIMVCAPEQTGKTDLALNCMAYTADRRPGNWLIVYPDEKTAGDMSRDRVRHIFEDSPRLRRYLTGYADDLAALRINLRNMRIYMAWANSAARLKSRPLPYVLLDEIDEFPASASRREGSPIDLARKRTRNFGHMRKIFRVSTPTVENHGIWKALNEDAEAIFVYWVRCQDCGADQQMEFSSIKWEGRGEADFRKILSDERSVWYECISCGSRWDDVKRDAAVSAGSWREREKVIALETYLAAHRPAAIGFHYRSWISHFVPMRRVAAAFLRGLKDKEALKNFQKSHAAEPWKVYEIERDEDRILELRDEQRPRSIVPGGGLVAALTAGVDTQKHGFWYEIRAWGWGLTKESWQIREGFVPSFEALAQVLWEHEYLDPDGKQYIVQLAVQDAMGEKTAEVYDFCRQHRGKILAFKGEARMNQPFTYSNIDFFPPNQKGLKRPIPGGLKLLRANVNYYKNDLSNLLEISPADPGAYHMHSETTTEWARQMCAEYIDDKGLWQQIASRDNHAWDCSVYSLVAADVLGIKYWNKEKAKKPQEPSPSAASAAPATRHESWIKTNRNWIRK